MVHDNHHENHYYNQYYLHDDDYHWFTIIHYWLRVFIIIMNH